MKYIILPAIALTTILTSCKSPCMTKCKAKKGCEATENVTLIDTLVINELPIDKVNSYTLAYTLANDMKRNGVDSIDFDFVDLAFRDVFENDTARLNDNDLQANIRRISSDLSEKKRKAELEKYKKNITEGERFIASIQQDSAVKSTPSGLYYKIINPGSDKKPTATDVVLANYEGKLIDGTVFDSSFERGPPIEFPLNRVIKGWTEGMQLIGEGGEIMLYIPHTLGYGEAGAGKAIPPYSTLIFRVQLIEVNPTNHDGHNH